jgi:hypothetical protein
MSTQNVFEKRKMRKYVICVFAVVFALSLSLPMDVAACEHRHSKKFVVYPSDLPDPFEKALEDTANIQEAFEAAVAAGPRSTVQLASGTFYLSSPIVVANFDGYFKGAGQEETIVQTLDEEYIFPLLPPPLEPWPTVFTFYQDETWPDDRPSTIKVSDMSINVKGKSEWISHGNLVESMGVFDIRGKITGVEDFQVSYVNAFFERITIEGETDITTSGGFNVHTSIYISGESIYEIIDGGLYWKYIKPMTGTYTVKDCSFKKVSQAISSWTLTDSTERVTRNSFDDVGFGIGNTDLSNTFLEISHNDLRNVHGFGVVTFQASQAVVGIDFGPIPELMPEPSTVLIRHNTIHCIEYSDGVGLLDFATLIGEDKRLNAYIFHNEIFLDYTLWGGIGGFAQDVVVMFNRIHGTGLAGIYTGIYGEKVSGWIIVGNDLDDLNAFVAPIWLGPFTSDCFVVARCGQILDMTDDPLTPEYDGNNIILCW